MSQMTIVDVVRIEYPGEIESGNVTFGQNYPGPIFITKWVVSGTAKPSEQSLINLIPSLQNDFDISNFQTVGKSLLKDYCDSVAKEKTYTSALTCVSYSSSTNVQWKTEADAFIAWRDTVYAYCFAQVELMKNGTRTVPSFEEFKTELPVISW